MEFGNFLRILSDLDARSLPGVDSHRKMIPKIRIVPSQAEIQRSNPSHAAVLALFYPGQDLQTRFLLTLRASYRGAHSSQISFPGGKFEENDLDLLQTALRETREETGVDADQVVIKRALSETYIPPSNFLVRPYLGFSENTPSFRPNHEVKEIIEVKLQDLLSDDSLGSKNLSTSYMKNIDVPCFFFNDHVVWGATAMMLSEIKDFIKLSFH
jgi:8-oxo-dGTP pyrophosphatase MutT (NUDIX family)